MWQLLRLFINGFPDYSSWLCEDGYIDVLPARYSIQQGTNLRSVAFMLDTANGENDMKMQLAAIVALASLSACENETTPAQEQEAEQLEDRADAIEEAGDERTDQIDQQTDAQVDALNNRAEALEDGEIAPGQAAPGATPGGGATPGSGMTGAPPANTGTPPANAAGAGENG